VTVPAYVLLEDGAWFPGTARRSFSPTPGEVVFTTNLTGYQEVFTDPSYLGQIVVMTAPMIGNYGINEEDLESGKPQVTGVVAMRGIVAEGEAPSDEVRAALDASPRMEGLDLASRATVPAEHAEGDPDAARHVVAYDFGMKRNIVRILTSLGCRVTVVPSTTSAARVRELEPDGLFLSNGPGDPAAVEYVLPEIRQLMESGLPTFGICLGHQLIARAFGGLTGKLPYGHRGGNHPVRDLDSGRVLITSQNHGFAVTGTSKAVSGTNALEVTHRNLNDDTVEGLRHLELPISAVQYHPEASPGPHDAMGHFSRFVQPLDSQ
jgi:carbamoyl-phosphate synthase small subunit